MVFSLIYDSDYFYCKLLFVWLVFCKLISIWQRGPLILHYNKKSKLMSDFIKETKVSQLVYQPYWFGLSPFFQSLFYMITEISYQVLYDEAFDRETFVLEDGGTLGIDWAHDKDDEDKNSARPNGKRPVLLLAPGLGGKSDNLYTTSLLTLART